MTAAEVSTTFVFNSVVHASSFVVDKSSISSRSPGDVEGEPVAKKTRLVHKTIIYDESIANQWLDEPPLDYTFSVRRYRVNKLKIMF